MMSFKTKVCSAILLVLVVACACVAMAATSVGPTMVWSEQGPSGYGNIYYGGGVFDGVFYTGQIDWGPRTYSKYQTEGTAFLDGIHWTDGPATSNRSSAKSSLLLGDYIFYTWQDGGVFRVDKNWSTNNIKTAVGSVQESLATDGTYIFSNDDTSRNTVHKWIVNNTASSFTLTEAPGWPVTIPGAGRFRAVSYSQGKVYAVDFTNTAIYEIDASTGVYSQIASYPVAGSGYQAVRYGDQLFVVGLDDTLHVFDKTGATWTASGDYNLGLGDLYGLGVTGDGTKATGVFITSISWTVSYWQLESYTATVQLELGDFAADPAGIPVMVDLTDQNGFSRTLDLVLDGSSQFALAGLEPGDYAMAIKPSHWLRYAVPGSFTIASDTELSYSWTFINGDVDGDNYIGDEDYLAVVNAYDSDSGSDIWNPDAELTGDGYIGDEDYLAVVDNYDQSGD